ncbi:MAG: membrane protein insertion efficiency factor YidD [Caldimicrobium sp.]|jgi:putative membrane protein insertion efficiency factor|uniref:Putative membrane protein insertion efficiency factor n=1 Tax=Caldimicrobium thiodismutans TaxID=1653476 RepID=A0A2N7PKN2_9BACT|nr:MAG: membrane protein insertion efficiency factor YidD [Caldimicrobium thiodismutans]
MIRNFFIKGITIYQRFVSPILSHYLGIHCRFYPSCSEYAKVAILRRGVIKGGLLALKRFLKCNPLFPGGIDLPPEKDSSKERKNG